MAPKIEFVKERHTAADRYWDKKGLTGKGEDSVFRHIQRYKGAQWPMDGWAGLSPEDCYTVNVTFSNTNTLISQLSQRNPDVRVTPKAPASDTVRSARMNQIVLQYFWQELNIKRQIDRALTDALILPFGLTRHGFTQAIDKFTDKGEMVEVFSSARPDLPWVRRVPCWDVRIDPLAESWHQEGDARWIEFRRLITPQQYKNEEGLINRRDLSKEKSEDIRDIREAQDKSTGIYMEFNDLIEVWECYDIVDHIWYAHGPGSNEYLRTPRDWPQDWETLPYTFLAFNEQVNDNVPIAFPDIYEPQQIMLNKVTTLIMELVKRLRRVVVANQQRFLEGAEAKLSGQLDLAEILFVQGDPEGALAQIQLGMFPAELLQVVGLIKDEMREILGLSNMDRAQRINVETATEAQGVLQGSAIHLGRNQERFENFVRENVRSFAQVLRNTVPEEMLFRITSPGDARELQQRGDFLTVRREDLQGEYDYDIRVGSTMPEDLNREFAKAVQLKTLYAEDPTINKRELDTILIEAAEHDSTRLLQSPEEIKKQQEYIDQQGLGGGPEGGNGKGTGKAPGVDANMMRSLSPGTGKAAQ